MMGTAVISELSEQSTDCMTPASLPSFLAIACTNLAKYLYFAQFLVFRCPPRSSWVVPLDFVDHILQRLCDRLPIVGQVWRKIFCRDQRRRQFYFASQDRHDDVSDFLPGPVVTHAGGCSAHEFG